jgi:acyl transferase domain-containing protein/aryl carrier-like protein
LSARSPQALRALAGAWEQYLKTCPEDISLHDLARNAALRRSHHDHRLAVIVSSRKELAENLAASRAGQTGAGAASDRMTAEPRLAFVCSGQGPQWWAMGRQLLEQEPVFRATIQRCDAIVRRLGPWSLLEELTADEARSRMAVTAISQPAIFALQVALAALWRSWGVEPAAVIGHSVGEVAAAHLAGVFSLDDAMRVIYQRGRCMELAPSRGRMLAAGIPVEEARRLLHPYGERVSLAAVNSAASVTLSGESGPLEEIARVLEEQGVFYRFLQVHYAFHSAQMDPVRDELLASLRGLQPRPAVRPLFSTVTGRRINGPELGPDYWWRNVRQTVQFAAGLDHLVHLGCDTVVELSPHPVLTASVAECYQQRGKKVHVLPSLRRREDERATMLRSLGRLYTLGQPIDWSGITPGPARTIRLPLYPWQRERFWFESEDSRWSRLAEPAHPLLGTSLAEPQPSWEARLDLRLTPYLNDHRIRNAVILPATAYVEMALAAARAVFGDTPCRLEDVKLTNPCFLTLDRPMRTHTVFHSGESMVRIHSRTINGEQDWIAHGSAIVRPQPAAGRSGEPSDTSGPARLAGPTESAASKFAPESIRQRCKRPFLREECYAYFRKIGLDYGPMFQGIERGWQGEQESLTVVCLPDETPAAEDYQFHPALLDACFQSVIPASKDFDEEINGLCVPVEIDAVHFHRRARRRVWCHARLRETTSRWWVADLDIYDENGQLSAEVRGLRSQRVAGAGEEKLDDLLYAYKWQAQPIAVADGPREPGAWLIFADHGGIGVRLAERLRAAGERCTLVFAGNCFSHTEDDLFEIHPGSAEDMTRLLREVTASGIVHLWNLDAPPADGLTVAALDTAQDAGLLSVLHLVQAWEKTSREQVAPLFLVTRGAQSVGDKPESLTVAQSPLLGLGRVICNEYPRLRCKLIDLDPAADSDGSGSLFKELTAADEEDEIAHRGGERFVHRYVSSTGEVANAAKDVPYRLTIGRPGNLDDLTPREVRRQPPGPGQVEIEVVAAGLNFSDVMKALGIYPGLGDGVVPLGAECSGRISAVGQGVVDLRVGDEVLAVAPFAFGSHVTTRAELTVLKPPGFTFEEAGTLPIAFLTASYALDHLGRLSVGERVLIHSATGGVGLAAIQCARRVGAEVFATAGTPEKREYLKKLGIEHVMDSRSLSFADEVIERTGGRGVDVVLNSLAGEALVRSLDVLADYGRFLEIGKRDVYGNSRLGLRPFRKNLSFFAIDLDRLIRERPALLGSLLRRIVQEARDGHLTPLPHGVYPIPDAIAAFRFMQQSKHIGKIVLSMREHPAATAPSEEPIAFRADATYLITGGLGGFGLAVARWMVERGARNLALLGRRGIHSPEARHAVAELETFGARVVVHCADAAKEEDVVAVLAEIERAGPPLRGVMHAAMVIEDSLLLNLDREQMRRVLSPKMSGAWNLHRHTLHHRLDFFVLFSSVASVFGHAGQANYAAANTFLDGLAWHRRAHGLPALTVNWGYLAEVGYLAERPQLGERLQRQGVESFTVRQALALLERAMQRRAIQISAVRVNWSRWRGLGVTGRVSPRFAYLLEQHASAERPQEQRGLPTFDALRTADPDKRRELVDVLLRDKLSRILGTSADRLDGDKPLLNLGVDSLMAVELRNWIEQELRVNLPIVELMRSPGLSALTDLLLELFTQEDGVSPSAPARTEQHNGHASPMAAAKPEELLAKLDDLPGEEVDALLAELLNDKHRDRSTTR